MEQLDKMIISCEDAIVDLKNNPKYKEKYGTTKIELINGDFEKMINICFVNYYKKDIPEEEIVLMEKVFNFYNLRLKELDEIKQTLKNNKITKDSVCNCIGMSRQNLFMRKDTIYRNLYIFITFLINRYNKEKEKKLMYKGENELFEEEFEIKRGIQSVLGENTKLSKIIEDQNEKITYLLNLIESTGDKNLLNLANKSLQE